MSAARAQGRPGGLDREKLAKVLAMAGSQHDGERANAAGLADRMVRAAGLTWEQVLSGGGTSRPGLDYSAAWQAGYAAGMAATGPAQRSKTAPGRRWDDDRDDYEDATWQSSDIRWEEFAASHADLAEWITENAARGQEFAKSLRAGVRKFGNLTTKQEAAVRRNIAREKEQVW